jgi:TRAP-type C4-dicarboxylate transport system substrate-binding protein
MRHSALTITILALLLGLAAGSAPAQQYTIKFATVAPEGSTWIKIMREYDKAVRAATGGKAGFRIYPGAVAGDEKDVIRKIRLGQYHAGGFTGVGLGEIAKRVRILDAPFLFKSYEEIDFIRDKYDAEFRKAYEDGGFVLLGWAEVGFVYIYSDRPVASPADLKASKMWMWEGDPIAQAAFQAIGVSPIQLSLTDVSTSLQTGMINTVYNAPYALVALQWFTRVKYVMSEPLAISNGAVVVSKKMFDSMPGDVQEALLANGRKYFRDLTLASRKENHDAIETLKKNGITTTVPPKDVAATFEHTGVQARRLLVNNLYSQQFLDDVEASLRVFRQKGK